MKTDYKRIGSRVPADVKEKIDEWAYKLGLSKSQFINICVQAGLYSVIRTIKPEDAVSPEYMALIVQAMEAQGVEIVIPEVKE